MRATRKFYSTVGATATDAASKAQTSSQFKRFLKLGVSSLLVCGMGAYAYRYYTDEGTRRSAKFWRVSGPIYGHYRLVQLLNRDLKILPDKIADPYYEKLHEKYAPVARDITYSLRGFYMKNAQLLSCQDNFMPEPYMRWMKDTQDNVPSEFKDREAREYCTKKMKEESNLVFDEVFEWWDDVPIGVASIGEVHRARLRGTHQEVAVKLQFPDMERRFRADIKTIREFCDIAMPQFSGSFNEVEKQFATEFDYQGEARNLMEIRSVIAPKYGKFVEIPKAHTELCSKHILVMDFLRGKKLVDGVRDHYRNLAKIMGTTLEALEEQQKRDIEAGTFTFKSLEEENEQTERIRWILWLKDVTSVTNISRFLYNNLTPLPFVYPKSDSTAGYLSYQWSERPLNLGKLLEIMAVVHAHELFAIGAFNGDPHPGNIMLMEDGRLGLIDYGQVKRLTIDQRIKYAKMILAHLHYDKDEAVRIAYEEWGVVTQHMNPEIGYKSSAFWNDRDTDDITNGMNMHLFLDWIQSQDPMLNLPDEYVMPGRLNILLRGMGKAFGLRMRMSELWADEAQAFLNSQGVDYVPPIAKTKTVTSIGNGAADRK